MIPHDYHLHSNYSPDCQESMVSMCEAAVAQGISEIGFTEHYDLHPDEWERDWFKVDAYFVELEKVRAQFARDLTVRAAVELGEPHIFQLECQELLAKHPFDYALGSLHWVGRRLVFDPQFFNRPIDESSRDFFEELERMTRVGGFDVLSHFDVIVRVGFDDPTRYEDVIRQVLRNVIEHGIALDINTAAFRRRAQRLTPGLEILRWYRELGGERVTLGSDAHRPEHVGGHLPVAIEALKAAGLTHLTFFER
ncbi:MAG TPA: histidinol-phosphatase HisJ family protein, partial [Anaerolineales bacterium]|nr:histidinol-phosphatase HisJ family protein [Anaerolineales bacterium]